MLEVATREALERHPVWAPYRGEPDRVRILAWGVPPAVLEAELARFDDCGPALLYPVLVPDPVPDTAGVVVAARIVTASGRERTGSALPPHVVSVFAGARELLFNRTLPGLAARQAAALAAALGEPVSALFPLRWTTGLRRPDGTALEGLLDRFW